MKVYSIRMPDEMAEGLNDHAKKQDRDLSFIIRQAASIYLAGADAEYVKRVNADREKRVNTSTLIAHVDEDKPIAPGSEPIQEDKPIVRRVIVPQTTTKGVRYFDEASGLWKRK